MFCHLAVLIQLCGERQGKRPKVHSKQKGFKNFFIFILHLLETVVKAEESIPTEAVVEEVVAKADEPKVEVVEEVVAKPEEPVVEAKAEGTH